MRRAAILLGFLLLLPTCTSTGTIDPPDAGDDGTCLEDADCQSGQTCKQGVCVGQTETGCAVTGCPEHAFCDVDGRCSLSGEKPCTSATDCGGAFLCPAGIDRCTEPCVLHTDCPDGYTCNNEIGGCVECTFDSDCTGDPARPHCLTVIGQCVECLDSGHCSEGYCEIAEGANDRYTCLPGCFSGNDCPVGDRCIDPDPGPGRCVDCTPDTQMGDCDPTTPYCEPESLDCVACYEDAHCGGETPRCHPERRCVRCLEDADCPSAFLCDTATSACVAGCNDDTKCPPDGETAKVKCDTMLGDRGACVECIDTTHCGIGEKCDDTDSDGYADTCVEGCDSVTICPDQWVCNPLLQRCVMCMNDNECPAEKYCDQADQAYVCRCHGQGDECTASDQCGESSLPGRDEPCHPMHWCTNQVKCGAGEPLQSINARCSAPCSIADQQDACPAGYMCRVVVSVEGEQRNKCIIDTECR